MRGGRDGDALAGAAFPGRTRCPLSRRYQTTDDGRPRYAKLTPLANVAAERRASR
ncbi:MAG: hypothetical protein LM522_01130 [Candidatus Contendobacter sp.]|nr:hypothetical protein [Candidatus Contendobacter sp.]